MLDDLAATECIPCIDCISAFEKFLSKLGSLHEGLGIRALAWSTSGTACRQRQQDSVECSKTWQAHPAAADSRQMTDSSGCQIRQALYAASDAAL